MATATNLMAASRQWAARPDDQRYLSLDELHAAVLQRKTESWTAVPKLSEVKVDATEDGALAVNVYDATAGQMRTIEPTHWSFGQLAQHARAPASYLRDLPAQLAAINMQYGFDHNALREDALMLCQSNGAQILRAVTSASFGRIWDHEVIEAVQRVNGDGRWVIPSASYSGKDPKRATTLYASDRDVFIFLVDPSRPVEVDGDVLYRGFYTWNSEVGAAVFGLTTFLYRVVCDNRIIWGATDIKELRIRHTGGAPERFAYEGAKYLRQYSEEATGGIVAQIKAAKSKEIQPGKDETLAEWLQKRGFTKPQAKASIDAAISEDGVEPRSVWALVNGITAHARTVPHTDARVDLETKAGDLMKLAQ